MNSSKLSPEDGVCLPNAWSIKLHNCVNCEASSWLLEKLISSKPYPNKSSPSDPWFIWGSEYFSFLVESSPQVEIMINSRNEEWQATSDPGPGHRIKFPFRCSWVLVTVPPGLALTSSFMEAVFPDSLSPSILNSTIADSPEQLYPCVCNWIFPCKHRIKSVKLHEEASAVFLLCHE